MTRHDRYGERLEPDDDTSTDDVHECDGGWVDRDSNPAVPCLVCRPRLTPKPRTRRPDPEVARAGSKAVRAVLNRHGVRWFPQSLIQRPAGFDPSESETQENPGDDREPRSPKGAA
ncbi:hypothetical protein [Amycolatopsis sp. NPDC051716]|uniref:hypothetical protein n=1 Tax=Amycolatopsis sp. NPDC051716 TaxID=3155804 RepID=UPI0034349A2F